MFAGSIINCHWFKTNFLLVQPTSFHGKVTYQFLFSSGVKCPFLLVNWFGRLDQTPFFSWIYHHFLAEIAHLWCLPDPFPVGPRRNEQVRRCNTPAQIGNLRWSAQQLPIASTRHQKKIGMCRANWLGVEPLITEKHALCWGKQGESIPFSDERVFWVCQILGWPEQFMINNLFSCLQDIQS